MKKTKLIVALLLVLVMLVSAFTACDDIAGLFGDKGNEGENEQHKTSCQKICSVCRCCYDPECTEADHDIKCECIVSEELAIAQAKRAIATNYTLEKAVATFKLPKAFPIKAYDEQRNEKTYEFALTWSLSYVEEEHLECITLDSESDPDNVIVNVKYESGFNTAVTEFKLVAAIAGANTNDSVELASAVPVFTTNTWAEYAEAGEGQSVTVDGVVTANYGSYNNVYLVDADGAYYVYAWAASAKDAAKELKPGDYVMVMGEKTTYQGLYELKNAVIVEHTPVEEAIAPQPVDATALFAAAENNKDASIVALQSQIITIKGVTILPVDDEATSNGYYKFTIGNVSSYMRKSSSSNILSADELTAFVTAWTDHAGYTADITGFVNVYGSAVYLLPAGECFANPVAPEKTPAEKVAGALEATRFVDAVGPASATEFDLPANGTGLYQEVAFTWGFKADTTHATAAISEGKIIFTLGDEAETVTLVLTATIEGTEPQTKEFVINVAPKGITWITAEQAVELAALLNGDNKEVSADKYYIYGTILDDPTADYCNFHFVGLDEKTGGIIVYGLWANETERYGSSRQIAEIPVSKGQTVFLYGNLQNYQGKLEITNALLLEAPAAGSCKENPLTGAQAMEMALLLDGTTNQVSEAKYYIKDVVLDAPTADYCNFHFVGLDEKTNGVIVYGLWANETERYGTKRQIAEIPFGVGYEVILCANLQNYGGKLELTNALLVSYQAPKAHVCTSVCLVCGGCKDADCTETACATKCSCATTTTHAGTSADPYTVADVLIEANKLASGTYSSEMVYVKGIITELSDKGSFCQNIYIVDEAGSTTKFLIYSANETEQVVNPCVGDTVTLCGYITNYSGTLEMTNQKIDGVDNYPTFQAIERGTSAISVDAASSDKATVNNLPASAENGSTFTFTVSVSEGFKVTAVKVNGKAVEAVEGVYSATVTGAMTVLVETAEEGAVILPTATLEYTGTSTGNMDGENQASALGCSVEAISAIGSKTNGGSNNVGLNKDGTMRFYKNHTCELAIAITGGTIKSITIEFGATYGTCEVKVGSSAVAVASGEAGANKTATYNIDAASLVIYNTNASTQVYIKSITITYELDK